MTQRSIFRATKELLVTDWILADSTPHDVLHIRSDCIESNAWLRSFRKADNTRPSAAGWGRRRCFKVMLLNDDYTPMDFVITVLQRFFTGH